MSIDQGQIKFAIMKEKDFRTSWYDRMSRHPTFMAWASVVLFVAFLLYLMSHWLSEMGAPVFTAIAISVIALVLSASEARRSLVMEKRQGDIKALHGLRTFLFIMENPKEIIDLVELNESKDKSISEIDEAIPSTSSRFRKILYWISLELRDIPLEYLDDYLIRQKRILAPAADEEVPDPGPKIVKVEKILHFCELIIGRIEYIYFGGPIITEDT